MESRWFVPKGKELKDTKIEDRSHALHVSKDSWDKLNSHLDRNRLAAEAQELEETRKKDMKETSEAMKKNWATSLEKLDHLTNAIEDKESRNYEHYMRLKKEQLEERKIYVAEMRERMFKKKDFPNALSSALILSEVVFERSKQNELQKTMQEHHMEKERKYAESVKQGAQDEIREKLEKKIKHEQKVKEYAKDLTQQKEAIALKNKLEFEKNRADELRDHEYLAQEAQELEEFKKKRVVDKKIRLKNDMLNHFKVQKEFHEREVQENKEAEEVIEIIDKYKTRVKCLTKQKEMEKLEEKAKRAEELSKILSNEQEVRDKFEEQIILKAQAEKLALEETRQQIDKDKKKKLREEVIASRKEDVERMKKQAAKEKDISKWELLNRFKTNDETKKHEERMKKETFAKDLSITKVWDDQVKDCAVVKNAIKEEEMNELEFIKAKNKKDDEEFHEYAEEVLDFAKSRGRTTYPIEKVVARYKRDIQNQPRPPKKCVHANEQQNDLLNKTPGKMAHDPCSDPGYHKSQCKCGCHTDVLYK